MTNPSKFSVSQDATATSRRFTPSRHHHRVNPHAAKGRAKHHYRPPAEPGMYNPGRDHYLSTDRGDLFRQNRQLTIQGKTWRTPVNLFDVAAAIGFFSQDRRPAYAGVRALADRAGLCVDTFIRYANQLEAMGAVGIERRPGPGNRHLTNLYRPFPSPVWQVFPRRTDSTNRAQVSSTKLDTVKSTASLLSTEAKAVDEVPAAQPPSPPPPVDPEPSEKPTGMPTAPGWQVATFIALVLTILRLTLTPREARSILMTCRRRGLLQYPPRAVVEAIRDDATFRDGFDTFKPGAINSTGAFVHARCQDMPRERIAVCAASRASRPTSLFCVESREQPVDAAGANATQVIDTKGIAVAPLRPMPRAPDPPRPPADAPRLTAERADAMLAAAGVDDGEFFDFLWEQPRRPSLWPPCEEVVRFWIERFVLTTKPPGGRIEFTSPAGEEQRE